MLLTIAFALITPTTPTPTVEALPLANSLYVPQDVDADAAKANAEKASTDWSGEVHFGAQIVSGNTSTISANAGAIGMKKGEDTLLTLKADWFFAEQRQGNAGNPANGVTQRSWTASAQFDRFFNEKTYGYVAASGTNDDVAQLDLRAAIGVGVGHVFYDEDDLKFKAEAGISYIDEGYADPTVIGAPNPDDSFTAVRLAYVWEQTLTETTKWLQTAEAFSNLDFNQVNGTLDSRLRTKVSDSLNAEVRWIGLYNNNAPTGIFSTDAKWLFSLVWTY
ncbi:MAG: putative salt-induced outer membrane protein YdiY [Planctomycetota bacterium]|jgi:putative salt-induced outer membrane protein YdiY